MAKASWTFEDYSGEKSTVELSIPEPAADGSDWSAIRTSVQDLQDKIEALTLCDESSEHIRVNESLEVATVTDPNAQRESGMRVFYQDNVTKKKFHFTIPGPDMTIVAQAGTDVVDLTVTEVAALVTELEASAVSPDGNSLTVTGARLVGRNS